MKSDTQVAAREMYEAMKSEADAAIAHGQYLMRIAQDAEQSPAPLDPSRVYSQAVRFLEEAHTNPVRFTNIGNLPQLMYRLAYQMGVSAGK